MKRTYFRTKNCPPTMARGGGQRVDKALRQTAPPVCWHASFFPPVKFWPATAEALQRAVHKNDAPSLPSLPNLPSLPGTYRGQIKPYGPLPYWSPNFCRGWKKHKRRAVLNYWSSPVSLGPLLLDPQIKRMFHALRRS